MIKVINTVMSNCSLDSIVRELVKNVNGIYSLQDSSNANSSSSNNSNNN